MKKHNTIQKHKEVISTISEVGVGRFFHLLRMKRQPLADPALEIFYQIADSVFGPVMIASTSLGVCHLQFCDQKKIALDKLRNDFPNAVLIPSKHDLHNAALSMLFAPANWNDAAHFHLQGTDFQILVWRALLTVSFGDTITYGELAKRINQPKAARAVGSAVAKNPIAYIIPCHRVVPASGGVGHYMWGPTRKAAILAWEAERVMSL